MWINRNDYEERVETNRKLLKDKIEKDEIIEGLKFQLENEEKHAIQLVNEKENLKQLNDYQKETIKTLGDNNDILIEENKKLIEWINKIINEVGIYEVKDRKSITIPIYKNPVRTYSGTFEGLKDKMANLVNQEEILIPEIRFIRMK